MSEFYVSPNGLVRVDGEDADGRLICTKPNGAKIAVWAVELTAKASADQWSKQRPKRWM